MYCTMYLTLYFEGEVDLTPKIHRC